MPKSPDRNNPADVRRWIEEWKRLADSAAERANKDMFLLELCDLLGVERPEPKGSHANAYVFERDVKARLDDETDEKGFIDLYKRDCFVLEAKQFASAKDKAAGTPLLPGMGESRGSGPRRDTPGHRKALIAAKRQAMRYAAALPVNEPAPPFLLVLDVGHSLELYEEFSRTGKNYAPHYLIAGKSTLTLDDLADPAVRERLALVWTDPMSLDRSREAAQISREIAGYLADLAARYEAEGHAPQLVAAFLTRCLFCMFAEDVNLLPKHGFRDLLISMRKNTGGFVPMMEGVFRDMNKGAELSGWFREKVLHFNGGLFADARALPLGKEQNGVSDTLELLIRAAKCDWSKVEPAIFGTLLERALNPKERHKLGAHFTPRAYVERLILPTMMKPLREAWENAQLDALDDFAAGRGTEARAKLHAFHRSLCELTVLDPACGSGNFLYVAYDLVKELEKEVLDTLRECGESDALLLTGAGVTVDPHNFLGLELNPRAVELANLVLWIGHLRWHRRIHGDAAPAEPVLKDFQNIRHADAALTYTRREIRRDKAGKELFVWDRQSMKEDPVTRRQVPDTTRVVPVYDYPDARPADWLALLGKDRVDFIIGNPPFIGGSKLREDLGDGYAEALWKAYPKMPPSADLVMYWWHNAATLTRSDLTGRGDPMPRCRRFGFITTNSLKQIQNRQVIDAHLTASVSPELPPVSLRFAIPDHPWVDNADGAAVRIAMTTAARVEEGAPVEGDWVTLAKEGEADADGAVPCDFAAPVRGRIHANLTTGAPVGDAVPLKANDGLSCPGFKLHGAGFIITPAEAKSLGLGVEPGLDQFIRPYRNNRDLTDAPRGVMVIDLFGLTDADVLRRFPKVYDHVSLTVKPERDAKAHTPDGKVYAKNWWLFGKTRSELRESLTGLPRYIATGETSKHRVFQFIDGEIAPDNMLVCIALSGAFHLGVLSSRWHFAWFEANAGSYGVYVGPIRYNKTVCFDPYPFPECEAALQRKIGEVAESLDKHRKQVTADTGEGLTAQYNALSDLRAGVALTPKQQTAIRELRVATLRQLHDQLDTLVAEAYGAPADLPEAEILERLCALNAERAAEEADGLIRYLRPEYQVKATPDDAAAPTKPKKATKAAAPKAPAKKPAKKPAKVATAPERKRDWPRARADRLKAVRRVLPRNGTPMPFDTLAQAFTYKDGSREKMEKQIRETADLLAEAGFIRRRGDTYRRG